MLAQIPEGAFGDLMRQELSRLTGVGASTSTQASTPQGRPRPPARMGAPTQKRSLVRASIAILLQQPSLAMSLEGDHDFSGLRLPGIDLLMELLALVRQRPEISTGALLEHFAEREEQAALQKLAAQVLPGDEHSWAMELHDVVAQLDKQLLRQRLDELQDKQRAQGLDDTDKYELRELFKALAAL